MTMTIRDIVKLYLDKNGYDGLFSDTHCFCLKEDIGSDCMCLVCKPGYKIDVHEDDPNFMDDYYIVPSQQDVRNSSNAHKVKYNCPFCSGDDDCKYCEGTRFIMPSLNGKPVYYSGAAYLEGYFSVTIQEMIHGDFFYQEEKVKFIPWRRR